MVKGRESGMPAAALWESFFDAEAAVRALFGGERVAGPLAEFGCGYGTFTLPAAACTDGIVTAFDIEPDLVRNLDARAAAHGLANVHAVQRDFLADGTGLPAHSQAHAMLLNLLHVEAPVALLGEVRRVLRDDGVLSVMHWRSDIPTPRGPPLAIRPGPEQCRAWLAQAGFARVAAVDVTRCCPYHFALLAYP